VAGLIRGALVAAALVAGAVGLASCGGGPNGDALKTCHGVHLALADYHRSLTAATPAARSADLRDAQHQMALVQADAAMANSQDGSFDALMTLVQESQEMAFANVAPALRSACSAITSTTSYL
jgi:hypothetical protein